MTSTRIPKHLTSSILFVADKSLQESKKKRYKSLWTLGAFSVEPSLVNSLRYCVKNTKHIRALNTNCPTKKFLDSVAPCFKGLKSIYIRKDQDTKLGFKAMLRTHRLLSNLKSYHCALSVKYMSIFRTLRRAENFDFRITDKALAKVNLKNFGLRVRHISGLERVSITALQIGLGDLLEFMRVLPKTKKFKFDLLELSLSKNYKNLDLSLLGKIEGLCISSISKLFMEFFAGNIDVFENLQLLNLSGNNPTILKIAEFEDYSVFSKFSQLEKLRFLKLFFRFPDAILPKTSEFFSSMKFPRNLEKLQLNLSNLSLSEDNKNLHGLAKSLLQLGNLEKLRSFHLKVDLVSSQKELINELFSLLPKRLASLKVFFLDIYSLDTILIKLQKIFAWLSTHKNLEYVHLIVPEINYKGFEEISTQEMTFPKLNTLHIISTDNDYFAVENFNDYLRFLSEIKQLRSLHFNCWGSRCSAADIANIVEHIGQLPVLRDLTISLDAQNIMIEELMRFKELLRRESYVYFFLFVRKRGYEITQDLAKKFEEYYMEEKQRMKKSLCIFVNKKTLL